MKKITYAFIACALVALVASACKSDDNDIVYSSDCYIKSFVLGNIKRALHTTSSTGADSIYYTTLTGSAFKMAIDQLHGTITNVTPIPTGAQLNAILATITAQGAVIYASASDTTAWKSFSAKDSIDFSSPVIFRIVATDGRSYRDYTTTLTVREADADSFLWTRIATLDALSQRTAIKVVNPTTILSADGNGNAYLTRSTDLTAWTDEPCAGLLAQPNINSTGCFGGKYWMSNSDHRLYCSDDASVWNEVEQDDNTAVSLVAASSQALYAVISSREASLLDDESQMASSTDGHTWTPMSIDELMFTEAKTSLAYTQTNGNDRVLLVADVLDNSSTSFYIWSLLEGYGQPWTLFSETKNPYLLPRTQQLSIVCYNGELLAIGNEKTYISYDNGITWKYHSNFVLPAAIYGAATLSAYAEDEYIYVAADNQLWRARLNSFGA